MNSISFFLEKEIEDLLHNLITKGKIELNKINSEKYTKGICKIIHKFIDAFINYSPNKKNFLWRNINYLNKKFRNKNLKNFKYKISNKKIIKNIFILII